MLLVLPKSQLYYFYYKINDSHLISLAPLRPNSEHYTTLHYFTFNSIHFYYRNGNNKIYIFQMCVRWYVWVSLFTPTTFVNTFFNLLLLFFWPRAGVCLYTIISIHVCMCVFFFFYFYFIFIQKYLFLYYNFNNFVLFYL